MNKTFDLIDDQFKIIFDYDPVLVSLVKGFPGRRFHGDGTKHWTASIMDSTYDTLIKAGFIPTAKARELRKISDFVPMQELTVPGLDDILYPFQKAGVWFIEEHGGRVMLADEMGLGKTIQAIAWLRLHPELRPALVVCPASLKLNWKAEYERFGAKERIQILSGTKPAESLTGDIVIINYDILSAWAWKIIEYKFQVIIGDEIHNIKNNTAKRTKAFRQIMKYKIPHFIALSGTPIVNRPVEFFNVLNLLNREQFHDRWTYLTRYCNPKYNGFGWDFNGASHTMELHEILTNSFMIRRLKKDVLTELPEKQISIVPIQGDLKKYEKMESEFVLWLGAKNVEKMTAKDSINILGEIEKLKQEAAAIKIDECVEWIKNFLESENKLVIFAVHHSTLDYLMEKFKGISVKLDGRDSMESRDAAIRQFQMNPKIRLFVGGLKSAGAGITLTAASDVAFIELGWSPGDHSQAEDRIHRIGQKSSVNIYYLIAEGTIEKQICRLLDKKRMVLDQVLDGKITDDTNLLMELLQTMKKRKN